MFKEQRFQGILNISNFLKTNVTAKNNLSKHFLYWHMRIVPL